MLRRPRSLVCFAFLVLLACSATFTIVSHLTTQPLLHASSLAVHTVVGNWFGGLSQQTQKKLLVYTAQTPSLLNHNVLDKNRHRSFGVWVPYLTKISEQQAQRKPGVDPQAHVEVWASGPRRVQQVDSEALQSLLTDDELGQLRELCGRCVFHTLLHSTIVLDHGQYAFVKTGDIPEMWIRDSAVQISVLMTRMDELPFLRQIVDAAIRMQAFFILQDPWANAFREQWAAHSETKDDGTRKRGGLGWVATRNFEVDYFLHLLSNYRHQPGLFAPEQLLNSSLVHDAVVAQLHCWRAEQRHADSSPYRFPELTNNGSGGPVGYTGMIWGGFRPSDDQQVFGYNIPANLYAAAALDRLVGLNEHMWRSPVIAELAREMSREIKAGVERFGVVEVQKGVQVYAYEVDGLGGALLDFDDPNPPSLLSLPLLGPPYYQQDVLAATRRRVLSPMNRYYYSSKRVAGLSGLGSPHTPPGYVWPLGLMVQGLVDTQAEGRAELLRSLLGLQCGNGLMHESVWVEDHMVCTRPLFQWANALLVVLYENSLGRSCTHPGLEHFYQQLVDREAALNPPSSVGPNSFLAPDGSSGELAEHPLQYGLLQAAVQYRSSRDQGAREGPQQWGEGDATQHKTPMPTLAQLFADEAPEGHDGAALPHSSGAA